MSSNSRHHYTLVLDHNDKNPQKASVSSKRLTNFIWVAICFFAGIAGFLVAQAGNNMVKGATPELECKPILSLESKQ